METESIYDGILTMIFFNLLWTIISSYRLQHSYKYMESYWYWKWYYKLPGLVETALTNSWCDGLCLRTWYSPRRHLFCTGSHLIELQSCTLILSTNFYFIFIFKYCTTQVSHWIVSCTKNNLFWNGYLVNWRTVL